MMDDVRPCRVTGLTSEKGQKLNGTAARARAPCTASGGETTRSGTERISVLVEGQPAPLSLKRTNVEFLPTNILDGGVGVGRGTIRDETFQVVAVDNMRGRKIGGSGTVLSGPSARAARCRGNLRAATTLLRSFRSLGNSGVVIMCTDLNVSRAIDIVVVGRDDTAALCSALSEPFQVMKAVIQKEVERGSFVMANYRPHRIEPDGFDKSQWRGDERLYAVTSGKFKIYPCLDKKNWDCMEVRYVDTPSEPSIGDKKTSVRQEIYLDYGADEAELYVQNAAALNETERLAPETLARVDPQAFWAAVLHVDTFSRAVALHGDASLVAKWLVVFDGVEKSREKWRKVAENSRIKLPAAIITGENSGWSIKSDADHEKIASGCSSIALLMMLQELECETPLHVRIDVLDCYRMSELASLISAISAANRREADHVAKGKVLHMKDRAAFMKLSLEEAGYGNGIYVSRDPLETCHYCKKVVDDMKMW